MSHTGIRIRDKRLARGLSQMQLAAELGISASYLNLIEHNRRRAGHELLENIARVLKVDLGVLSEKVAPDVVAALKEVAAQAHLSPSDADQAIDIASRFPEWARLLIETARPDVQPDDSIKELIQMVAGIGAASQSLVDRPEEVDDWSRRFAQEVRQKTSTLNRLVRSLSEARPVVSPQAEADEWLNARNGHVPEIEAGADPRDIAGASGLSQDAQYVLYRWLSVCRDDATVLPASDFSKAAQSVAWDPVLLARKIRVDPALILRRLATVPGGPETGLFVTDRAGRVLRHQPLEGLTDAHDPCPLLPVFDTVALGDFTLDIKGLGQVDAYVQSYADAADMWNGNRMNRVMLYRRGAHPQAGSRQVGPTCKRCADDGCLARRLPYKNAER